MNSLKFTKMHGLGNDFIVINDLGAQPASSGTLTPSFVRKICDRRFGVGGDQILWLRWPSVSASGSMTDNDPKPDARMEIFNADGSSAEMCGNGIRAVALYLNQHVFKGKTEFRIETVAGVKRVELIEAKGGGSSVRVDMGVPALGTEIMSGGERLQVTDTPEAELRFYEVNVGNPHAVFFLTDMEKFSVEKWGPLVEGHIRFPNRTNVEFVEIINPHVIQVRVWERGAGITLACGTGACAAAVASLAVGQTQNPVEVRLPGGPLQITWAGHGKPVMMEGPAEEVFSGEYRL